MYLLEMKLFNFLKPNLLLPYPGKGLTYQRRIFNYRLSRARRISENTFGITAARWRIFRRPIEMHPEHVDLIVKACCCLHHYLQTKSKENYNPPQFSDYEDRSGNLHNGTWREETLNDSGYQNARLGGNRPSSDAMEIRGKFASYFCSEAGKVLWQEHMVTRVGY